MIDPRMRKLADVLVDHSITLQKGEVVYIEAFDMPEEMLEVLVEKVYQREAIPLISLRSNRLLRKFLKGADEKTVRITAETELEKIKRSQAYIGMRGAMNIMENSDVSAENMKLYHEHWLGPVHTNWRTWRSAWCSPGAACLPPAPRSRSWRIKD